MFSFYNNLLLFAGVQESVILCVRNEDQKSVSPYLCPQESRPEILIKTCNDHPCPPRWNHSDFSQCSKPCGIGIQTRDVNCIHEVTRGGGNTIIVPNNMCPQPPPPDRQYCNVLDCPVKWHTTDWTKVTITNISFYNQLLPPVLFLSQDKVFKLTKSLTICLAIWILYQHYWMK